MRIFLTSLLILFTAAGPTSQSNTILIQGGMVIDGTGTKPRRADVRVSGDSIEGTGTLKPRPGERVIDATGKVVAPGFIDMHSHAAGRLADEPDAETQVRQGITTIVVGQDGSSELPLSEFFKSVSERTAAVNVASFVGHGTLRREVMGGDFKRAATAAEIGRMVELADREMSAGAFGLSSGLEYDPGFYSTTEELTALARVAKKYRGIYISHVRDEANKALESFREVVAIAREAQIPAQISHIKLGSTRVWGKANEVLRLIADARREGLDVSADVYPYLYWHSTITVLIPTRDWNDRAAWEKGLAEVGGAKNVLLSTYTPDSNWQGKTIAEIARSTGKDPVTVIQEIVSKTRGEGANGRQAVIVTSMIEEDLRKFLAAPGIMFCSDGAMRGRHPRGAGTYPRILGRYVREQKVISLEEAIRKMTSLPADRLGVTDRGRLREGMKADVVIFDAERVIDHATTADPTAAPEGIESVIVNGQVVLDQQKITGTRPGRVLRKGKS